MCMINVICSTLVGIILTTMFFVFKNEKGEINRSAYNKNYKKGE